MAAPIFALRHAQLSPCSPIGDSSPEETLYGKRTSLSEHPSFAAPLTHAYGVAVGLHSNDWGDMRQSQEAALGEDGNCRIQIHVPRRRQ